MSEYQYYDFRAMDRALTKAEMAELRDISTRASITSTSFTNHYEWGNLKADPLKLLERYFDVFLYVANWGTRELYLRIPQELADYGVLKSMLLGEAAHVRKAGKYLIVGFSSESEFDDWDDGTTWMGSLMPLRSELLLGDRRGLYLGWLLCAQNEEFDGDNLEPEVPPGLRELPASLQSLIEFLEIDEDLVEVAALTSAPLKAGPSRKELDAWIRNLSEQEKTDLLIAALSEQGERWRVNLLRRFQQSDNTRTASTPSATQLRTVAELLGTAQERAEERTRKAEAKSAAEEARRKAEEKIKREKYLDQLEKREAETWKQIAAHILKRQPNEYERAVSLIVDLRDVALRNGGMDSFYLALEELRREHSAKGSFLHRLAKANL